MRQQDGTTIRQGTLPPDRLNTVGYIPINPTDVITLDYFNSIVGEGGKVKVPVKIATNLNIDIVTGGNLSTQGVSLVDGDRVLLFGQTDQIENGIYDVSSTTWTRSSDFDDDVPEEVYSGVLIIAEEGTFSDKLFYVSGTGDVVVGTDPIVFGQIQASGVSSIFDGNRAIKALPGIGDVPGGTTLEEWVNNVFYPSLTATISLNSFSLQEVGVLFTPTIVGSIDVEDSIINLRKVIDVTNSDTVINNPTTDSISYTDTDKLIVEGVTQSYRLEADITTNGVSDTISTANRDISGVYPIFSGMSPNILDGNTIYTDLNKLIENQGTKNVNLVGSASYIYFAYPASYSNLSSIIDQNGFDILPSFTQTIVIVNSTGLNTDWSVSYKVYQSNLTTVNNQIFQFNF